MRTILMRIRKIREETFPAMMAQTSISDSMRIRAAKSFFLCELRHYILNIKYYYGVD